MHHERLIQSGPVILAMNHQSYLDPPFAGTACNRAIYYLARKIAARSADFSAGSCRSSTSFRSIRKAAIAARSKRSFAFCAPGMARSFFPEGSRTLDGNLQPALPGVGFVIAKTLAPVVPMRIFGAHEALPRGGGKLRLSSDHNCRRRTDSFFRVRICSRLAKIFISDLSERVMNAIAALQLEPRK